jgi:hypothetical protein
MGRECLSSEATMVENGSGHRTIHVPKRTPVQYIVYAISTVHAEEDDRLAISDTRTSRWWFDISVPN